MSGPVTVNLVATSVAAWYPTLYYSIDSAPEVRDDQAQYVLTPDNQYRVGTLPLVVNKEGITTIDFTSVIWKSSYTCVAEEFGYHTVTIRIDRYGPEVTSDVKPEYASSATVKVTAKDLASGLDEFELRLDDEATQTVSVTSNTASKLVTTSSKGEHHITYRATDKLGHVSQGTIPFEVKEAQSVTLSAPTVVSYNGKPKFTGSATSAAGAIAGHTVFLEMQNGSTWTRVGETTTTATGAYTVYGPALTSARSFRLVSDGDSDYASFTSAPKLVKSYASLSNPVAPTSVYRNKSFTTYAYLKPRHTSGTYPVRLYRYRYVSGAYRLYGGYITAKASNYYSYTKVSRSLSLPYAGKWRIRAYAPADAGHAATWSSGYDYVTVK